jgi:hypothetical protein
MAEHRQCPQARVLVSSVDNRRKCGSCVFPPKTARHNSTFVVYCHKWQCALLHFWMLAAKIYKN